MPVLGLGLGLAKQGPLPFTPHRIAGLVLELDARNPANLIYDGANAISQWNDTSGAGNNAVQATGAAQPLLVLGALNGYPVVRFDGADDFLKTAPFTLNQPATVLMVVKQISWTANRRPFDGNASSSATIAQYPTTPGLTVYTGGAIPGPNNGLAVGTWGLVRVLFNAAGSEIQVNLNAALTSAVENVAVGGATIGAAGDGTLPSNIDTAYVGVYNRSITASEYAALYAWAARTFAL